MSNNGRAISFIDEQIYVVCLVMVDKKGCFFATQRPADKSLAFHWEFPGGKVEEDESPEVALRREIQEELGIDVGALVPMPAVTHAYDFGPIRLLPFKSYCLSRPILSLTEHVDAKWVYPHDWQSLKWAPADIPVIHRLLSEGA